MDPGEVQELIADMTPEEAVEACADVGLALPESAAGVSLSVLQCALKSHYSGRKLTVREAFNEMDRDGSGALDKQELHEAFASLGRLFGPGDLEKTFRHMDADGDGEVSFDEFEHWILEQDETAELQRKMGVRRKAGMSLALKTPGMHIIAAMTPEMARSECQRAGIEVDDTVSLEAMKAGLQALYGGRQKTVREIFYDLDTSHKGYLVEEQVDKAFASLGKLMSRKELASAFRQMDKDGGGTVSFAEFKQFLFKEHTPPGAEDEDFGEEDLIDDLTMEEAMEACREVGMQVKGTVGLKSMKLALKTHYSRKDKTVREAFDEIDTDNSGYLDREEVELAFAAMGKLMSAQELTATFRQMDKDGGGTVSFAEFKQWMFNENNQTDLTATDELDSMSIDEAAAECRKAGLAVSGSVSLEAMKLALKTHNQKRTVREAFDDIDTDNSGFLDKAELGLDRVTNYTGSALAV